MRNLLLLFITISLFSCSKEKGLDTTSNVSYTPPLVNTSTKQYKTQLGGDSINLSLNDTLVYSQLLEEGANVYLFDNSHSCGNSFVIITRILKGAIINYPNQTSTSILPYTASRSGNLTIVFNVVSYGIKSDGSQSYQINTSYFIE